MDASSLAKKIRENLQKIDDREKTFELWAQRINHFQIELGTEIDSQRKSRVINFLRAAAKDATSREIKDIIVGLKLNYIFYKWSTILFTFQMYLYGPECS